MRENKIRRSIMAGFVATLIMTAVMYLAPLIGMPKMDVAAMLGSFLTGSEAAPFSGAWNLGMLIHFINGTFIFPIIFVLLFYTRISTKVWIEGMAFGALLWFLSQVFVMPLMGAGFFSGQAASPVLMVIGSLLGHLIYGFVLGKLIGEPVITEKARTEIEIEEEASVEGRA